MSKRILVVDDEQDVRVFMTTILETSGFKPWRQKTARKACKWLGARNLP